MRMKTKDEVLNFLDIQQSTLEIIKESYCLFSVGEEELYPEYLFTNKGLNAHASVVAATFRKANFSGDEIHEWMNTPSDYLNGMSPIEYGFDDTVRMIASVHADISSL